MQLFFLLNLLLWLSFHGEIDIRGFLKKIIPNNIKLLPTFILLDLSLFAEDKLIPIFDGILGPSLEDLN